MMAQPNHAPLFPSPFSVISPQFIDPKPLEIIFEKYPCRNFVITDMNHKIMLKVKPCDTTFHRQRVLLDVNDKPIAMLRVKNMSMHSRWNVYKGESHADSDILFSTKSEHVIHFKTNVCVMLANKTGVVNDHCDLRIKGSWSMGNCTIYMGDSSTVIAQMHKPQKLKYATNKFTVTIEANMDYACVVALFAIVDAMENPNEVKKGSSGDVGTMLDIAGAVLSFSSSDD
ncbi:hypothetical protein QVD17_28089 [Tagetes erecta]|uniref:Tubby C-terminal-like domain-containing protein n=1 Tax=Tagetes erecta TaxID=13708 RepID=A0AAD8NSE3_TARER|nr:hypothetical protein QVD17_28089 [Tagetes erecta]